MDELISIIEQRKAALRELSPNGRRRHKSMLIEDQRKRCERQNWILRVLKALKVLTIQQKRVVIDITVKIMNLYHSTQCKIQNYDRINFIQTFINLFVEFYNKFQDLDLSHIKTIIRPNNSFILVDLLKSLLELSRKQFKNAIQNVFKSDSGRISERKLSEKLEKMESKSETLVKNQPKVVEKDRENRVPDLLAQNVKKIQNSLYEKYSKAVQQYNPENINEKINEVYFDLMYLNQKNGLRIQKYLDTCFGVKRHINYDVSGLYTQQEIKQMVSDQKERAESRAAGLKQLKGNCSSEQLKEYFKIKVEIHQTQNSLITKKTHAIRPWLPLAIIKNGDKFHPYTQVIEANGMFCTIQEFEDRHNKKLKAYLKERLNQCLLSGKQQRLENNVEIGSFNKRDFLDYGNSKLLQLLNKQTPLYTVKKDKEKDSLKEKECLLPPISTSQEQIINRARKAKSDSRLPGTALMLPYSKASQNMGEILQKRINMSSIDTQKKVPKRNIEYLIDKIIRSREYTIH